MFKDVYYLLKNNLDTIPLDKLYAMSEEYEITPYMFYVLYYTGQVFKDKILEKYIEAFRTPEGEALLNCYGLCAAEELWVGLYGEGIKEKNPYKVFFDKENEAWVIQGTLTFNTVGGVPYLLIEMKTGKVLAVWHDK